MKINSLLFWFSVANFLALFVCAFLLPSAIPMHVNLNLVVDAVASPFWILIFGAIPVAAMALIFLEFKSLERFKKERGWYITLITLTLVCIYITWVIYFIGATGLGLGDKFEFSPAIILALPFVVLFLAMAVIMPKLEVNHKVGIRTPATLKNEKVWKKTHEFASPLYLALGLLLFVLSLVSYFSMNIFIFVIAFIAVIVLAALVPVIYARCLVKNKKQAR